MHFSQIRGANTQSGLLYRDMNGLRQYKATQPLLPISPNLTPQLYANTQNFALLNKRMRDGLGDSLPGGEEDIPDLANRNLEDGGFRNRGKTMSQGKPVRLNVPDKFEDIGSADLSEMPLSREKPMTQREETKFTKFLKAH
tara:strand:+ start:243 stop:665 length:423 start_codon:yes stop_codon:yes gene_type:complete